MQWARTEQIVLLLGIAAVVAGGAALVVLRRPQPPVRIIEPPSVTEIAVQVDGEVRRPGVYRLPAGSRVGDALRLAGGPTFSADAGSINAARLLRDGERVTVPPRGHAPSPAGSSAVNMNAATAQELEALPGIGPVLAGRILAYRARHGPFRGLEDLLQVEGIGPGLLRRLRGAVRFD